MTAGLLPNGFYDELAPHAPERMRSIHVLLNHMMDAEYQLVDPPLVEFEDTLFEGAGSALAGETFRVMDPKSHRMMGIRADMTVQIARIARTRLYAEARPLRLAYAGQVLRVKGDGLYGQRQLWQTGIELVGSDALESEMEVLELALSGLEVLGIQKDVCVDFTIPPLVPRFLESLHIPSAERQEILYAMDKKDAAGMKRLVKDSVATQLLPLIEMEVSLDHVLALDIPKDMHALCLRLQEMIVLLKKKKRQVRISVDLLESLKFPYHTGIAFSVFAKGAKSELAKGGRYDILCASGRAEPACGVTFYVNELLRMKLNDPD